MSRRATSVALSAWLCAVAVARGGAVLAAPLSEPQSARPPELPSALGPIVVQEPEWGEAPPVPEVAWRFQAAAPASAAPAVSATGAVYLSTVEGYVHALDKEGSFRWSHGLVGVPIGEPALGATGQVYVATTARRVYSLRSDGHLEWERHAPSRIASAAVWSSGRLYCSARDGSLYAWSAAGDQLGSILLGSSALAPTSLGSGGLAVATERGELQVVRGNTLGARSPLPRAASQPVLAAGDRLWVVTQGELLAFETQPVLEVSWRAPARQAALSADGQWLVVAAEGGLTWRAAGSGELRQRVPLPDEMSAAPAVSNAGLALIPLVSGELLLLGPDRAESARVRVGNAPLWRPIWDEARQRALVAAGSGALVAIDVGAWAAARERGGSRVGREGASPPGGGT